LKKSEKEVKKLTPWNIRDIIACEINETDKPAMKIINEVMAKRLINL
jgi:hypothetical protein